MTHQNVVDDDANREWHNSRPLDVHRWSDYPEAHLAVHMKKDAYSNGTVAVKGKSRYNELHIKYTITKQHMRADIFVSHSVSHQSIANMKNAYTSIG